MESKQKIISPHGYTLLIGEQVEQGDMAYLYSNGRETWVEIDEPVYEVWIAGEPGTVPVARRDHRISHVQLELF